MRIPHTLNLGDCVVLAIVKGMVQRRHPRDILALGTASLEHSSTEDSLFNFQVISLLMQCVNLHASHDGAQNPGENRSA
jgi:hypothetical protein